MKDDLHMLIYLGLYSPDPSQPPHPPISHHQLYRYQKCSFQAPDCNTLCAKCLVLIYSCCGK